MLLVADSVDTLLEVGFMILSVIEPRRTPRLKLLRAADGPGGGAAAVSPIGSSGMVALSPAESSVALCPLAPRVQLPYLSLGTIARVTTTALLLTAYGSYWYRLDG
jgi:hypothetical protein